MESRTIFLTLYSGRPGTSGGGPFTRRYSAAKRIAPHTTAPPSSPEDESLSSRWRHCWGAESPCCLTMSWAERQMSRGSISWPPSAERPSSSSEGGIMRKLIALFTSRVWTFSPVRLARLNLRQCVGRIPDLKISRVRRDMGGISN